MSSAAAARTRRRLLGTRPLAAYTPTTLTAPDLLDKEFSACRRQGFALNNQEFTAGIIGVAVPVLGRGKQPVAALACHAPTARISLEDLVAEVPKLQRQAALLGEVWYAV